MGGGRRRRGQEPGPELRTHHFCRLKQTLRCPTRVAKQGRFVCRRGRRAVGTHRSERVTEAQGGHAPGQSGGRAPAGPCAGAEEGVGSQGAAARFVKGGTRPGAAPRASGCPAAPFTGACPLVSTVNTLPRRLSVCCGRLGLAPQRVSRPRPAQCSALGQLPSCAGRGACDLCDLALWWTWNLEDLWVSVCRVFS